MSPLALFMWYMFCGFDCSRCRTWHLSGWKFICIFIYHSGRFVRSSCKQCGELLSYVSVAYSLVPSTNTDVRLFMIPGTSLTNIVNNIGLIVLHVQIPSVAGHLGMPLSKLRPCPLFQFQNCLLVSGNADVILCRIPSRNRGR